MSKRGSSVDEITSRADALIGAQKWTEAEALLLDGLETAAREGRQSMELSLCSELMGFYRQRNDARGFYAARDRAFSLLEAIRVDALARGTILINAATGMVAFGECRDALDVYREAESCYRRALGSGDVRLAALNNNMAFAFAGCGENARAEGKIKEAVAILEKLPHHPDLGTSYVNLALLYAGTDAADPRIGECLDKAEACFDDPEMIWDGYYAHTARKCAGGFAALGRQKEADELEERAEMIYAGT